MLLSCCRCSWYCCPYWLCLQSIVNYEISVPEGICHWQVNIEDKESANLLNELPAAVNWLERALRQPRTKTLVHCNAGTSRSPAVITAALMKAKGLTLPKALEVLRNKAPHASPNPGFMAQLALWGDMGCDIDEAHPAYKQFMLDQIAYCWEAEGWVDPGSFADLPKDEETVKQLARYRCRKCRQLLVTEHNVVSQAGVGHCTFRRQQRQQFQSQQQLHQKQQEDLNTQQNDLYPAVNSQVGLEQGSVFVEPMLWMRDQITGPVQGKLYCPKCQTRLGSFNWAGITNHTGGWMIPGFQLHMSHIDAPSPALPAALARLRLPAQLAPNRAALQQQGVDGSPADADNAAEGGSVPSQQ
eukprot:GHRR01032881.1.p1 GENE.GHRR01032881.1~~GHRR01032881.1.p1  ORF type:complete len:356 (+),score=106.91 GHRR01032881.1:23-1090(+)